MRDPFPHALARIRAEISGPGMAALDAPPTIPGYVLRDRIAEGGMGAVYLAEDEMLGRKVAIKVSDEELARDGSVRRSLLQEAKVMASVSHPHVVHVYGYGVCDRGPFIVMEHVDGASLKDRIDAGGPLAVAAALDIVLQMIDALDAVWQRGIVHRDVKPSNILLDAAGYVRVCDFGLACPAPTASAQRVAVQPSGVVSAQRAAAQPCAIASSQAEPGADGISGTPHYMSPEQALGEPADFRADIYALGVVLYEMLTGRPPVDSERLGEIITRHVEGALAKLDDGVNPRVAALYEWMTHKHRRRRPSSYAELRERVRAVRQDTAHLREPFSQRTPRTWS